MAIFNLTIYGVKISQEATELASNKLVLSTEQQKSGKNYVLVKKAVKLKNQKNEDQTYSLTLQNLQFTKKMYQPTNIVAEIAVAIDDPNTAWSPVMRDVVVSSFKGKKVSLWDVQGVSNSNSIYSYKKVGEDFYVSSVNVRYKENYMRIYLHINSLDKMLTEDNTCRTFVGKKLCADIMKDVVTKIAAPYDNNQKLAYTNSMQNLSYTHSGKATEHIFPFLVQYNESSYDMLARTANRWGEFLYYEDGKLTVGCPTSTAISLPMNQSEVDAQDEAVIKVPLFESISYYDVDSMEACGDKFDCAAGYDDNMLNDPTRIDPEKVSGNLFQWGGKVDKVIMKKFASFFKNDKNLPTFIGNELFNDLYDLGKQEINVAYKNNKRENKFFTSTMKSAAPEKYAEHNYGKDGDDDKAMSYNPFSEIHSVYDKAKYFTILKNEISAGKDALCINFDTNYPCLKLGQVITVYGKDYIITQIDCKSDHPLKLKDDLWVITTDKVVYSFQVYAVAKQGSQFYPTVIPSGHVRLAEPQMATVTDAGDPNGNGRVRVMFSWQHGSKDKIDDDVKKASSPWLQFTANAGGQKGIMGAHYEGDKVFVGFVDGNVERPYVLGAISKGAGADIHCATPGGHQLKIADDASGITAFLTGIFSPSFSTFCDFVPGLGDVNPFSGDKNNLALAGGFELSDNYGIYKISGSTDGRQVSIASPWGDVAINAFTGISISAPNGDVKISGKNVTIEAGNNLKLVSGKNVNYKLWKEKDTKKGSASQFLLDVTAAVAKKLTEKVVNIVDLSMVRNVVEIVMRPVEGNLTVKSNRYLMLESGKNACAYPAAAYTPEKQKDIDDKATQDILSATGKKIGVDKGMVDLFKSIDGIVANINKSYGEIYEKCVDLKNDLKEAIEDLDDWKNSYGKADKYVTTKGSFDDLYKNELKGKLWGRAQYSDLTEADLCFSDEVEINGNSDQIVSTACHEAHKLRYSGYGKLRTGYSVITAIDKCIIEKRIDLRKKALKVLNKLAKQIWLLEHFEMDKSLVGKNISWYSFTAVPKDFKAKMVEAFSREKCPDSPYYKANLPENVKDLEGGKLTNNTTYNDNDKKLMRRMVSLNLLEALGFTDEMRMEIVINPAAPVPAGGAPAKEKPAKPNVTDLSRNPGSILNDDTWKNYIKSLNGLPPLGRDNTTIGGAIKDALADAKNNLLFWKGLGERSTWSEGSNGQILFGINNGTYVLKTESMDAQSKMATTVKYLKDTDFADESPEKQQIQNFMENVRKALKEL